MGGASLTGRPGCDRRHARTARFRGRPSKPDQRGRGFATCQSLAFSRHRSFLTAPLLGSRRRRDSARLSGLAGRPRMRHFPARGLALPGLAPPEPAREPTCRRRRAAAEGNQREAIEWPRRGQDWLLGPRTRAAASAGGGGAGQVGGPQTPWASASSASCQARRDPREIRRSERGEQGKEGRIPF